MKLVYCNEFNLIRFRVKSAAPDVGLIYLRPVVDLNVVDWIQIIVIHCALH